MRLVDADALIDNICRYASPEMAWDRIDIVHKINEMPTIEERKTGKWIQMEVSSGRDSWKCSVCGRRARGKLKNLPYCHCGAMMEGEQT